jgi:hypothetical protein
VERKDKDTRVCYESVKSQRLRKKGRKDEEGERVI